MGYKQNPSVKITSGVDSSVVLIGSTISVLKPKLLNHEIRAEGEFLFQRAIRTRGIKSLFIPEKKNGIVILMPAEFWLIIISLINLYLI